MRRRMSAYLRSVLDRFRILYTRLGIPVEDRLGIGMRLLFRSRNRLNARHRPRQESRHVELPVDRQNMAIFKTFFSRRELVNFRFDSARNNITNRFD